MGSLFRDMTQEEGDLLQGLLDDVHDQFIEAVAVGRDIEKERLIPLADGRVFTGRQAKELGLVDEIGNMEDAIRITADMVGIVGEPSIIEKKKRFSIIDIIRNRSLIDWLSAGKRIVGGEGIFSMKYILGDYATRRR